jgi:hypothetical protein
MVGPAKLLLKVASTAFFAVLGAPFWFFSQRASDINVPTPLPDGDILVIAFMGGRDAWHDRNVGVGRMAAALRARSLGNVHIVTIENLKRSLAVDLVKRAFDWDDNGKFEPKTIQQARLIVYGQSWGGAAVVKFAHELQALGIPILLSVQVDSVGIGDETIPANVRRAANFYQRNGKLIRGEPEIRATDPTRTTILFNQLHDYSKKEIKMRKRPWWKSVVRTDHLKMDDDQEVWNAVEQLILEEIATAKR